MVVPQEESGRVLQEQEDLAFYSDMPHNPPMTEEKFDNIENDVIEKFKKERGGYSCLSDWLMCAYNKAALDVIPEEYYRVWYGRYPKLYDTYKHTPKYNNQAYYYINKALACGIAKTAEEAIQYFQDNR